MAFHNGMFFSTFDRDNDRGSPYSCALAWLGGWWYNDCHRSNLNGEYGNTGGSKGINWYHWKGFTYSMKEVRMLVRKPWPWKKKCESIKPHMHCVMQQTWQFFVQNLRKRRVAKLWFLGTYFLLLIF